MSKRPRITGRELLRALQKVGFVLIRTKGSHHFLKHSDGRATVVPIYAGETIGPGLLLQILRDCEVTVEQLAEFL